jgi:superfamily II DNA or RNA helicase/ankyrin repeat protein
MQAFLKKPLNFQIYYKYFVGVHRIMPKIVLEKAASQGKVIEINGVPIKIEYYQNDPQCPFLVYGAKNKITNSKIYILEIRKNDQNIPIYPGIDSLNNFKKDARGALLYINSDIPVGWKLNLPTHMPTTILGVVEKEMPATAVAIPVVPTVPVAVSRTITAPSATATSVPNATTKPAATPVAVAIARTPALATTVAPAASSFKRLKTGNTPGPWKTPKPAFGGKSTPVLGLHKRKNIESEAIVPETPSLPSSSNSASQAKPVSVKTSPPLQKPPVNPNTTPALLSSPQPGSGTGSGSGTGTGTGTGTGSTLPFAFPKVNPDRIPHTSPKTSAPSSVKNLFLPKSAKTLPGGPVGMGRSNSASSASTPNIPLARKAFPSSLSSFKSAGTVPVARRTSPPTLHTKLLTASASLSAAQIAANAMATFVAKNAIAMPPAVSIEIRNNIPNIQQHQIGNERLRTWLAKMVESKLEKNKRAIPMTTDMELEEGELAEDVNCSTMEVEPHQLRSFQEYLTGRLKGDYDTVLEWATGAGKTFFFSKLPGITGEKFFIGVPLITLEDQAASSVEKFCPHLAVGKLRECKGDSKDAIRTFFEKYDVVVGTYQKLRLNKSYENLPFDIISTFVFDEAHNGLTKETESLIKYARSKGTAIIAATATPRINKKNDGRDNVYHFFGFNDPVLKEKLPNKKDNPLTSFTIREAIIEGVCAPVVTALVIPKGAEKIKFTHKTKKGTLKIEDNSDKISEDDAARTIDKEEYNNIFVHLYMNGRDTYTMGQGPQKRTVYGSPFRGEQGMVYCAGISHSDHMAEAFNKVEIEEFDKTGRLRQHYENNIYLEKVATCKKSYERKKKADPTAILMPFALSVEQDAKLKREAHNEATTGKTKFCIAKAIHSKLSPTDRQAAIKQFKLGGICLATGDTMLAEGLDHPTASLVFIASNINSEKSLLQKAGRGGRKIRGEDQGVEKGKIWRVFNMVWPTLRNSKYFFMYLSEKGAIEPEFTRGNDKIAAIRSAYLATQMNNREDANNSNHSTENLPISIGTISSTPQYDMLFEPNQDLKNLINVKLQRGKALKSKKNLKSAKKKSAGLKLSIAECIEYINQAAGQIGTILDKFSNIEAVELNSFTLSHMGEALEAPETAKKKSKSLKAKNAKLNVDKETEEEICEALETAAEELKAVKDAFSTSKSRRHKKRTDKDGDDSSPKRKNAADTLESFAQKLKKLYLAYQKTSENLKTLLMQAVINNKTVITGNGAKELDSEELKNILDNMETIQNEFKKIGAELGAKKLLLEAMLNKRRSIPARILNQLKPTEAPTASVLSQAQKSKRAKKSKQNGATAGSQTSLLDVWYQKNGSEGLFPLIPDRFLSLPQNGPLKDVMELTRTNKILEIVKRNPLAINATHKISGDTLIHAVCAIDDVALLLGLLQLSTHQWVNQKNLAGNTPLHLLANMPNRYILPFAAILLNNNADPNVCNNDHETPLHSAVRHNNLPLTMLLMAFGAKLDIQSSKENHTPVTLAKAVCKESNLKAEFEYLFTQKINDFDIVQTNNRSLAHRVSNNKDPITLTILLKKGAKYSLPDNEGNLPLHLAANDSEFRPKDAYGCIQVLMGYGLRNHDLETILKTKNKNLETPIHLIMKKPERQSKSIDILIDAEIGAKAVCEIFAQQNNNGMTPLHIFMSSIGIRGFAPRNLRQSEITIILELLKKIYRKYPPALKITMPDGKTTPLHLFYLNVISIINNETQSVDSAIARSLTQPNSKGSKDSKDAREITTGPFFERNRNIYIKINEIDFIQEQAATPDLAQLKKQIELNLILLQQKIDEANKRLGIKKIPKPTEALIPSAPRSSASASDSEHFTADARTSKPPAAEALALSAALMEDDLYSLEPYPEAVDSRQPVSEPSMFGVPMLDMPMPGVAAAAMAIPTTKQKSNDKVKTRLSNTSNVSHEDSDSIETLQNSNELTMAKNSLIKIARIILDSTEAQLNCTVALYRKELENFEKKYLPANLQTFCKALKVNPQKINALTKFELLDFFFKALNSHNFYTSQQFLSSNYRIEGFSDFFDEPGDEQEAVSAVNAAVQKRLLSDFLLVDIGSILKEDKSQGEFYSDEHEEEVAKYQHKAKLKAILSGVEDESDSDDDSNATASASTTSSDSDNSNDSDNETLDSSSSAEMEGSDSEAGRDHPIAAMASSNSAAVRPNPLTFAYAAASAARASTPFLPKRAAAAAAAAATATPMQT